ncbi:MAG: hypothetical protein IIZ36_01880, partial [Ruminococcus sp.]|nr:hypothetical protein [Ruminococcus sp.]
MKGIVFSFPRTERTAESRRISLANQKYYIKRYGVRASLVLILLCGLGLGAVYAVKSDVELLKSLDFLFTTNLEARMSNSFLSTFCA